MVRSLIVFFALLLPTAMTRCSTGPTAPLATPRNADEQKAIDLAAKHLRKQNLDSGAPKTITPAEEDAFWLMYPTSENEMKLIGERTVIANVKAEQVETMKRR